MSAEANRELSAILEVEDEETRNYVEGILNDLQTGAVQIEACNLAAARQEQMRAG